MADTDASGHRGNPATSRTRPLRPYRTTHHRTLAPASGPLRRRASRVETSCAGPSSDRQIEIAATDTALKVERARGIGFHDPGICAIVVEPVYVSVVGTGYSAKDSCAIGQYLRPGADFDLAAAVAELIGNGRLGADLKP